MKREVGLKKYGVEEANEYVRKEDTKLGTNTTIVDKYLVRSHTCGWLVCYSRRLVVAGAVVALCKFWV